MKKIEGKIRRPRRKLNLARAVAFVNFLGQVPPDTKFGLFEIQGAVRTGVRGFPVNQRYETELRVAKERGFVRHLGKDTYRRIGPAREDAPIEFEELEDRITYALSGDEWMD